MQLEHEAENRSPIVRVFNGSELLIYQFRLFIRMNLIVQIGGGGCAMIFIFRNYMYQPIYLYSDRTTRNIIDQTKWIVNEMVNNNG